MTFPSLENKIIYLPFSSMGEIANQTVSSMDRIGSHLTNRTYILKFYLWIKSMDKNLWMTNMDKALKN